ncbi:MAG: Hpt domain-containing protein [Chitinophagales bacterium]|nr:Hpt domain-containing protein [Chitinophagales bacterium]
MRQENHPILSATSRNTRSRNSRYALNLDYLMELADGDQDFVTEVIQMFLADAPEVLRQSIAYLKTGNYTLLKIGVHKLKSSIRMLGNETLAQLAQDIENDIQDNNNLDEIRMVFIEFVMGVRQLLDSLRCEINKR